MESRPEDWQQAPGFRLNKLLLPATKIVFAWLKRVVRGRWRRKVSNG